MAAFPDTSQPHEFHLEHANAAGVDMFSTVIVSCTGDVNAWNTLNRELPVRLFELPSGGPALHWWARDPEPDRGRPRSQQVVFPIPEWLWSLLRGETDAATIRTVGKQYGIYYPEQPEERNQ